jgi:hypothetical protein
MRVGGTEAAVLAAALGDGEWGAVVSGHCTPSPPSRESGKETGPRHLVDVESNSVR